MYSSANYNSNTKLRDELDTRRSRSSMKMKSYNNLEESWKAIGNVKSGMRDLEEKIKNYTNNLKNFTLTNNSSSFYNNSATNTLNNFNTNSYLNFNDNSHQSLMNSNHFHNHHYHQPNNQSYLQFKSNSNMSFKSAQKLRPNGLSSPYLQQQQQHQQQFKPIGTGSSMFESSSSTIQAGDPSFIVNKSMLLNGYDNLDYINPDIKYLNEVTLNTNNKIENSNNSRTKTSTTSKNKNKTTKVDVFVPSDKKPPTPTPSSNRLNLISSTSSLNRSNSMISKDKLTRKLSSDQTKSYRSSSEDVTNNKYTEFLQSSSSQLLAPPQQQQQRVLHRESDLLPISSEFNSKTITKRHLASASSNNLIENASMNSSNKYLTNNFEFVKPISRKIAFPNSGHHQSSSKFNDLDENNLNDESSNLMLKNIHSMTSNGKEKKYDATTNIKEETDRLLGLTSSSSKKFKKSSVNDLVNYNNYDLTNPNTNSAQSMLQYQSSTNKNGIITTSSWRIGEAIVQKQLKHHLLEQEKEKKKIHQQQDEILNQQQQQQFHPDQLRYPAHRSSSAPVTAQSPQAPKQQQQQQKTKRTDCHLIQTNGLSSSNQPVQSKSSISNSGGSSSKQQQLTVGNNSSNSPQLNNNKNKSRPYDLNDIHKYIQTQKTRRLNETKTEKEKQKMQDEERKKKLQELYRKQRIQALKSAQANQTSSKLQTNLNSSSNANSANNSNSEKPASSSQNKIYEQDMSKLLMDRISHLLNDNDKLVERQRKHYLPDSVTSSSSKSKFVSKRFKRVEFEDNKENDDFDDYDMKQEHDHDQNENGYESMSSSTTSINTINNNSVNLTPTKAHKITTISTKPVGGSSSTQNMKHDRLKKICSMALDLQTKLQQTKLKLFGFNPNDEDDLIDYYDKANKMNQENDTFITSTKHDIGLEEDEENSFNNEESESDFFKQSKDKLANFEREFKQQVKEDKLNRLKKKEYEIDNDLDNGDYNDEEYTEMSDKLPGIGNLASFKPGELTRDLAARKIQSAYRLYLSKRNKKVPPLPKKSTSHKREEKQPKSEQKLMSKFENLLQKGDNYNFINVYRKKTGDGLPQVSSKDMSSSHSRGGNKESKIENNYSEDFLSYNPQETHQHHHHQTQTIKSTLINSSSASTSSSSDSTSLSKYITNSKHSTARQHQSAKNSSMNSMPSQKNRSQLTELQAITNQDESASSSIDATSTSTASSTSTTTNQTTTSSKQTLQTSHKVTETSSNKPRSILIEQNKKTRIVYDYERENVKEPKRYSPSSLERLLSAGINYYDTLNMSALQLEELDKIRCIGYAQQETVALAHLLKENKLSNVKPVEDNDQRQQHKADKTDKSSKPRSLSMSSNLSSSSTSSSTSASMSLSNENENEAETESENKKPKSKKQHDSRKSNVKEQDISVINTISDLNTTDNNNKKSGFNEEDNDLDISYRQILPSEHHMKKSKQDKDQRDHSLSYDLSQSSFSQFDSQPSARLSFEDDSFKKFTSEIVKKYMQEEELRSKHQANLLKLREKALIEKTKSELSWLEQMKKKAQDKGEDDKMPSILRKEKGIMQKLKQEQDNINKMKEVQRKATEKRLKILSQHSDVVKWCQNKLKQQGLKLNQSTSATVVGNKSTTNINNETTKDQSIISDQSINTTAIPNQNSNDNELDEVSTATIPSSSSSSSSTTTPITTQISSSTGVVTNQIDEDQDESSLNINNQSLTESKKMKQIKQHLSSEKYLTEREKKLRLRRKHAEEIIAWKKKLDDEELQVREIEKRANQVLKEKPQPQQQQQQQQLQQHAKPSSSNVVNKPVDKKDKKEKFDEEDTSISSEVIQTESKIQTIANLNKASNIKNVENSYADTFISTASNLNNQQSKEKLNRKDNKSIKTEDVNTSMTYEPVVSIPTQLGNDDSSIPTSIDQKNEDETHKDGSTSTVSSISETRTTISSSTSSSVRELEIKVKELKKEYLKKRNEAEELGKMLKEAEKLKMKEKEEQLRKKIESYDIKLEKIKSVLNNQEKEQEKEKEKEKENVKEKKLKENLKSETTSITSEIKTDKNDPLKIKNKLSEEGDLSSSSSNSSSSISSSKLVKQPNQEQSINTEIEKLSKNDDDEEKSTSKSSSSLSKQAQSKVQSPRLDDKPSTVKTSASSSSTSSSKSTRPDTKLTESIKYDEDFDSEKVGSSSSKDSKDKKKEIPNLHGQNDFKPKLEEEDTKSTVSEISEDILENSINNKKAVEDLDIDDVSRSSNSSTDTQILLLGSSRTHKPSNDMREDKREKAIENLEKTLVDEVINQMIEIKEKKSSKLLAEQYQESLKELEEDDHDMSDDELDKNINDLDKYVSANSDNNNKDKKDKIHIPSIDLRLNDDEDDSDLMKTGKKSDTLKEDTLKAPVFNIPYTKEKITNLCDLAIENYYWNRLDELKSIIESNYLDETLVNEPELAEFFKSSNQTPLERSLNDSTPANTGTPIEINFKKMLFDLIGELLYDLYLERYEEAEQISEFLPGHKKPLKKKHFKSYINGPNDLKRVKDLIKNKVCSFLKLGDDNSILNNAKRQDKSKWRMQKKLDLVDSLLDLEMREQENEWSNYEVEEYEAKLHISNTIFDMILKDTIDCFKINIIKKNS